MWTYNKLVKFIDELDVTTNKLAEEIKDIKEKMRGKGIYPAEAPIIISRLEEIEGALRQIGANKDLPLPLMTE